MFCTVAAACAMTLCFNSVATAEFVRPAHGESMPKSYIVIDPYTNVVYGTKKPEKIWITASLNKAMAVYLLFDHMHKNNETIDSTLTISKAAENYLKGYDASLLHAKAGDVLTYDQAARAMIAKSAGDVAYAIAEHVSGDHKSFVKLMNDTAKEWGMHKTIFADASGFGKSPARYKPRAYSTSTACDMAVMMSRILTTYPNLYTRYFGATDYIYKGKRHSGSNLFTEYYDHAAGQKTGYLNASRNNLVATARMGEVELVGVSLGTYWRQDSFNHMAQQFDVAFNHIMDDVDITGQKPLANHPHTSFSDICPMPKA